MALAQAFPWPVDGSNLGPGECSFTFQRLDRNRPDGCHQLGNSINVNVIGAQRDNQEQRMRNANVIGNVLRILATNFSDTKTLGRSSTDVCGILVCFSAMVLLWNGLPHRCLDFTTDVILSLAIRRPTHAQSPGVCKAF